MERPYIRPENNRVMSITLDKIKERNNTPGIMDNNLEIKEYKTKLELLYDVAQQASSASEVSELLEEILSVTQRLLQASASSLFMIDEEKREFCLRAAGGEKSNMLEQIRLDLDSGIIGWVARNGMPVVVNDVSLDKHFNKNVDEATGFATNSIIATPLMRGQKVIGVLEMINKVDGSRFTEKDLGLLTEFTSTEALILLVSMAVTLIDNFKMCQSIQDRYKSTVETLVTAADAKDPYAYGHSRRVKEYTLLAANSLCFSSEELKAIEFGALLHDIGKIGIQDSILRKPGPLTSEELYIIRKHALKGAEIVGDIPNLETSTDIVLHHHERYDGKGYPEGLKGEDIPIGARLVAVADAFDTMTTDHSYRAALRADEAINELVKCSGTQFCPVALEAFLSGFQKREGTLVKKKTEQATEVMASTEAGETGEAKERAKLEAEKPKKAKDAKKLARKQAKQEAKERAKLETEKPKKAKEAEKLATTETEQVTEDNARSEAEKARKLEISDKSTDDICSELYEGDVQLLIRSLVSYEQINQFKKCLRAVENLRILLNGGAEDEDFMIVVSVQKPMALDAILSDMPVIESLYKEDKNIVITLKTIDES